MQCWVRRSWSSDVLPLFQTDNTPCIFKRCSTWNLEVARSVLLISPCAHCAPTTVLRSESKKAPAQTLTRMHASKTIFEYARTARLQEQKTIGIQQGGIQVFRGGYTSMLGKLVRYEGSKRAVGYMTNSRPTSRRITDDNKPQKSPTNKQT